MYLIISLLSICFLSTPLLPTAFLAPTSLHAEEQIPSIPVKTAVQYFKGKDGEYLVLNFENYPEWHTYWKNPGDAGLPIKNVFSVAGKPIHLEEMEWPAPRRFIEQGNMWAYGYDGSYSIFFKISKNDFNKLSGKEIELQSTWLVCKHICIPGQKRTHFKISPGKIVSTESQDLAEYPSGTLAERFNSLPQLATIPDYLKLQLSKGREEKSLILSYEVAKALDLSILKNNNLLYSFPLLPFDFRHENLVVIENGIQGITKVGWDGEYQDPPLDLPQDGKFKKPFTLKFIFSDPIQNKTFIIEKKFVEFEINNKLLQAPAPPTNSAIAPLTPASPAATATIKAPLVKENIVVPSSPQSIIYYLILAFVGGLILNVMPCVLPVISLKLFGLIKYKNESHTTILRHNFFYTAGILFTFFILATVVLSLKSIGTQVGWGFQLQSPNFIATMIVGLFIFSLNLFGLFEFMTPGGKSLGNVTLTDNFTGDFISGMLATILSTPCSAPFLGTALTFAFTSSTLEIYLIFSMIGLGLASPFILTAIYPQLVAFLPRPGKWMNNVKIVLGFTLVLTMIWLLDVYNSLVDGSSHITKLTVALTFILAGFLLFRKKEKMISIASFSMALAFFVNLNLTTIVSSKDEQTSLIRDKQAKGLDWQPWSEAKMQEHKTNHQDVFIDFTAKWCFTCKVNEKLVLETEEFKNLIREKNVKLLIADWTKRDELIGSFLRANGLVGVPAYFIQKKNGTLVNLGETISISRIKENLSVD